MQHDVLIRGDGCVGRALALALSRQGLRVALRGRPERSSGPDLRAYALNTASKRLLSDLKVWDALSPDARTPVRDMKVQGDQAGAHIGFSASQSEVEALTWIVDAAELEAQLETALRFAPHVERVLDDVPHALLALCEGREAGSRAALGVSTRAHRYGHSAVAARLVSDRPHHGVAWQWFRDGEVLALLPLDRPQAGHGWALVWSQPAERATRWLDASPTDFEAALQAHSQGLAGELKLASERKAWPLQWLQADRVSGPGFVLLGDCAHQVHPLSGQGLNLGLGDVATLAEVLAAREAWRPLGDERLLRRYDRKRVWPTRLMGGGADALWAGFAHDSPWVASLRNHGLNWVDQMPPLKRWLAQRAMG
ncbi:FAD-dependent monooxygenase [Inhella gelatinilytica]|uniref:FAD-dependent monooxygenase n=1 Tax=Inhella gelatinilytica TaxID=2795030 RepID=A0A931ITI0_9BURK|nr:FAD-dependent monooxygenase [Inhella gelatinilytica]MBH9551231.1 FAD-dependent monooxygenase [Inhella gelatinilytica]